MTDTPEASAPAGRWGIRDYDDLAEQVLASGILTDPWLDGKPRLAQDPVEISEALFRCDAYARLGCDVAFDRRLQNERQWGGKCTCALQIERE